MQITIVTQPQLKHQVGPHDAMADGLKRHGVEVVRVTEGQPVEGDAVVCWGWRIGRKLRDDGFDVLVMERGYVGDIEARRKWVSCGWNGLNGRAKFPKAEDGKRWREHFSGYMQPWQYKDGHVLLVGQVPGDAAVRGGKHLEWLREAYAEIIALGEKVVFRPHPMAGAVSYGNLAPVSTSSLADEWARAKYVVTFNSNTGVDAALAGVPVVVMDEGSMAWPVAGHEIGDIEMPDRDTWAHNLAYAQWSEDEIRAGEAWEYLEAVR